jgi:DNA polymerase/3'-5' exonuclease PolX
MIKIKLKNKINKQNLNKSINLNKNIINQFEKLVELIKKNNKLELNSKIKKINGYRIKHFLYAINVISNIPYVITLDNVKMLEKIDGISKGTVNRIIEILNNGFLQEINILEKELFSKNKDVEIINDLNNIVGIGDISALKLIKKFNIKSIEDLKEKVDNKIIDVNDKIKLGLKYYGKYETNIPRDEINQIYNYLDEKISKFNKKLLFFICGSYRRNKITSNDIDILLINKDIIYQDDIYESDCLNDIVSMLKEDNFIKDDLTGIDGKTKYMGFCKYKNNPIRRIDIRMVGVESFATALVYFTGSYELNQMMRKQAKKLNYKLNEYGLFNIDTNEMILIKSEEDLFNILQMKYLEPYER